MCIGEKRGVEGAWHLLERCLQKLTFVLTFSYLSYCCANDLNGLQLASHVMTFKNIIIRFNIKDCRQLFRYSCRTTENKTEQTWKT